MAKLLSEFEAAKEVKISPTLLRWFTSYSAKSDGRKLKFTIIKGIYHYDREELLDFNHYLHMPWPKPAGQQRPSIPAGIMTEVKAECQYRCPICNTNNGELAHIKAVSKSFDNHPHNLIFLCPNHHTVYDFGYKYKNISEEDVLTHKKSMQTFQLMRWDLQNEVVISYLSLINRLDRVIKLEESLLKACTEEEFEDLLKSIFNKIDSQKRKEKENKEITKLIESIKAPKGSSVKQIARNYLSVKAEVEKEYRLNKNVIVCSLCHGNGSTAFFDICPVCEGEGYLDKGKNIDISIYEIENCPLCKGRGKTDDFDNCPACFGEGKLTREQIATTNFSNYDLKACPLCKGRGRTDDFEICPPCYGEGKLTKEQLENIDLSIYDLVKCPLCKGRGSTDDFEICPPCYGEGKLTKEQLESIDFSIYELVKCPLCKGRGSTDDFEICPPCHGEGKITKEQKGNIDFSVYKMEKCPLCKGKGETDKYEICPTCQGEGKMSREQIQITNFGEY